MRHGLSRTLLLQISVPATAGPFVFVQWAQKKNNPMQSRHDLWRDPTAASGVLTPVACGKLCTRRTEPGRLRWRIYSSHGLTRCF